MLRKNVLLFLVLFLFFVPFLSIAQTVHAEDGEEEQFQIMVNPVVNKAVNQGTKKMAKGIVKDITWEMSTQMVLDYKYTPLGGETPKEGNVFVCLPNDKTSDGGCNKLYQMKEHLGVEDKKKIESKIETVMDKKITGGIGQTKWGKFANWALPTFTVGLGVALVDYSIDGDVSSLFDEIAFESLTESGLIEGDTSGMTPEERSLSDPRLRKRIYKDRGGTVTAWDSKTVDVLFLVTEKSNGNKVYVQEVLKIEYSDGTYKWQYNRYSNYYEILPTFTTYIYDVPIYPIAPKPSYSDLNKTEPTIKPKTKLPVVSPGALKYEDSETGEQLLPYPKPDGGLGFKTGTGVEYENPENVEVKDPELQPQPDGSTIVKKQPTVQNPNPTPSDDGTIPSGGVASPNPPPEFSEGQSCDRELEFPDVGLLYNTVSDAFPFSIPWDLKDAFEALFEKMGSEKPSFEYDIDFQGKSYSFDLSIPEYFDGWMPFIHSMLIFIFDIGLIYAIYRFMGGGD